MLYKTKRKLVEAFIVILTFIGLPATIVYCAMCSGGDEYDIIAQDQDGEAQNNPYEIEIEVNNDC